MACTAPIKTIQLSFKLGSSCWYFYLQIVHIS
jgi:hypothetical protein